MGLIHRFACGACGYAANVAGGRDTGMSATRITVVCQACRELHDVVVAMRGGYPHTLEHRVQPRCPTCHSAQRVVPWAHPGPCPRCSETLTAEAVVEFWD